MIISPDSICVGTLFHFGERGIQIDAVDHAVDHGCSLLDDVLSVIIICGNRNRGEQGKKHENSENE